MTCDMRLGHPYPVEPNERDHRDQSDKNAKTDINCVQKKTTFLSVVRVTTAGEKQKCGSSSL
jgi:hypothetical protein